MTLPVPLTVRLGDGHITRAVSDVSFRKEAVGGLRSMSLSLKRGIANLDPDLVPLTKVYVYDARTAETVAEGRLADSGRSAGPEGQSWEVVAFGPAQHASDITGPLIYADRNVSDAFRQIATTQPSITVGWGSRPGDTSTVPVQGVLISMPQGLTITATSSGTALYDRIRESGQKFARVYAAWNSADPSSTLRVQMAMRTNGGAETLIQDSASTLLSGAALAEVVSGFPAGSNTLSIRFQYIGGSFTLANDNAWAWWGALAMRTMLMDKTGADITTGYGLDSVTASEVVADLLGRRLNQFDGVTASVATTTFPIPHLAYLDGVTAEQVLSDLMKFEPGYRWYAGPDVTGNGYSFRWELWPTTVRYEATLDDGGSFPISGQDLYNEVLVRWIDEAGQAKFTTRTLACPPLDDEEIVRRGFVDLGAEAGSEAAAIVAGDGFLAQHNVPTNAGSMIVARPIRDIVVGRMVDPWEIEPGELIRVRGVESYPDSLNADSNDGQTVFRIFAVDYSSSNNTAKLELDTDPTDTAAVLAKLMNARARR